jgi:hypothetical protein
MKYTTDLNAYKSEETTRIEQYYKNSKPKLKGFVNKDAFIKWYLQELTTNECTCHYCKTSILSIRELLNTEKIKGRKIKGDRWRGPNFELDRKNPNGLYSEENCVLSCYYCNNDKSNTFSYETYADIIGPTRKQVWEQLLNNK